MLSDPAFVTQMTHSIGQLGRQRGDLGHTIGAMFSEDVIARIAARADEGSMDEQRARLGRIVVVARPTFGRGLEATLRTAGYEVHRTPGDANLTGLVTRLQAHAIIIALDLPWLNAIDAVYPLLDRRRPMPVLLLGETGDDPRVDGLIRLPLTVDAARLLEAVAGLLSNPDP